MILLSFVAICGLVPVQICFAENTEKNEIPQNFEQAKVLIFELITPLPDTVKQLYKDDVVPMFRKIGDIAINPLIQGKDFVIDAWNDDIKPITQDITDKIKLFLGKEIEQKKPEIEKEFEKEKQEIQKEIESQIPEIKETIWQKIKDIIN